MEDRFLLMLKMQHQLQLVIPPQGRDPSKLRGDERAQYMRDQSLACFAEMVEALDETGWKPWATSRHFNSHPWLIEMVDAWHFFMNLLMVGADEMGITLEQFVDEFTKAYIAKNQKNMERHKDGQYDGLHKCTNCKRDLSEIPSLELRTWKGQKFCGERCAEEWVDFNHMETRERA